MKTGIKKLWSWSRRIFFGSTTESVGYAAIPPQRPAALESVSSGAGSVSESSAGSVSRGTPADHARVQDGSKIQKVQRAPRRKIFFDSGADLRVCSRCNRLKTYGAWRNSKCWCGKCKPPRNPWLNLKSRTCAEPFDSAQDKLCRSIENPKSEMEATNG